MTCFLVLLVLGFLCSSGVYGQCRQGWYQFGESCYGFGEDFVTWGDAQEICEVFKGKLAEIETSEENAFLKNLARTEGGSLYWLGGTDIFQEGVWEWATTGETINLFTDWAPGEPNEGGSHEDCLTYYDQEDYHWNDTPCGNLYNFICETGLLEAVVG